MHKNMNYSNKTTDTSTDKAQGLYDRIKATLAVASQFIIAAPVKLPPKVVAVARYVALAIGVLEAVEQAAREPLAGKGGADDEG